VKTTLVDPRTGRVRGTAPVTREEGIRSAVGAARAAAPAWRALTPRERARRLERLAARVTENAAACAVREMAGTGKPDSETAGEVERAADLLRCYASAVRAQSAPAAGTLRRGPRELGAHVHGRALVFLAQPPRIVVVSGRPAGPAAQADDGARRAAVAGRGQ
jgi:acyl-CoA reductase-like NAD-dependent aldehyde dehydrogenase